MKILNQYAEKIPPIVELSKKVKLEPGMVLGGIFIVTSLLTLLFFGLSILTVIVTVLYPGFKSIKTVETSSSEGKDESSDWLTYWTVFGIFSIFEVLLGFILNVIPFYYLLRLGFFIWLMHPQYQGANVIYTIVVGPAIKKHKENMNNIIE